MKQIVCEMCGSSKLIKKDGVFECQYCGCQYTPDEAKKLIIEGKVIIDETNKVVNWLKLADTAYNNSSWADAYIYYSKILETYPDEWRSTYRKALTIGWQSTLAHIRINETIGGISDGYSLLINSDNTDAFKAWGVIAIEKDLLAWLLSVHSTSVKHANEYTSRLESACYDYYQRSAMIASVIRFAMSMFTNFVVMHIEDLDLADGVFRAIGSATNSIRDALATNFKVNLGKKYSTFWSTYIDDYSYISPPEYALNASSETIVAFNKLAKDYKSWEHERLLKDNPDYDKEVQYNEAIEKKSTGDISSLEEAAAIFDGLANYKNSKSLVFECRDLIKGKKYTEAVEKKKIGNIKSLNEATLLFEEIIDYRDSRALDMECKQRISELTFLKKQKSKRFKKIGTVAFIPIFVVFLTLSTKYYFIPYMENNQTYKDAVILMEKEDYSGAMRKFEAIQNFKDSYDLLMECKEELYMEALRLKIRNKYDEAMEILQDIQDYKDTPTLMSEIESLSKKTETPESPKMPEGQIIDDKNSMKTILVEADCWMERHDTFYSLTFKKSGIGYKKANRIEGAQPEQFHWHITEDNTLIISFKHDLKYKIMLIDSDYWLVRSSGDKEWGRVDKY